MALDPSIALQGVDTNPNAELNQAQTAATQQATSQKAAAFPVQMNSDQINLKKSQNDLGLALLRTVTDQDSYNRARSVAQSYGIDESYLPDTWTPDLQQKLLYAGSSAAQALRAQMQAAGLQINAGIKTGDPTTFTQSGSPGANVLGLSGSAAPPAVATPTTTQVAPPAAVGSSAPIPNGAAVPPAQPVTSAGLNPPTLASSLPAATFGPVNGNNMSNTQPLPANTTGATVPAMAQASNALSVASQQNAVPQKGPYETTQAYQARLKAAGNPDVNLIMDQAAQAGQPITRAQAEAVKAGRDTAMNAQGQVTPLPGAPAAIQTMANSKETGTQQAEVSSAAAKQQQEGIGKQSAETEEDINERADNAVATLRNNAELSKLSQDVGLGNTAPVAMALKSWAISLGMDPDQADAESTGDAQALQKLTVKLATQSTKELSTRPAQMEFLKNLENTPGLAMTPSGFNTILQFSNQGAQMDLQKQQAFQQYKGQLPQGASVDTSDFKSKWNQQQVANIPNTLSTSATSAPATNNASPASINLLKGQPTPQNRAFFDQRYGAGASAQVLGGQ